MAADGQPRSKPPRQSGSDSLFTQVTQSLAIAIVSGDLPVGALVPNEEGPAGGAGTSRTAYREAMRYLAGKGLIEARPRSGTRVAPQTSWHLLDPDVLRWSLSARPNESFIRDLFELRMMIEPGCARLAALRRTEQQLEEIRQAIIGMRTEAPYSEGNMRHDLAFHEAIFRASGNAAVSALVGVVSTTLLWSLRVQMGKTAEDFQESLNDHIRVFGAIERQDGDGAATLTRIIVADALRATLASLGPDRRRHAIN